MFLAEKRNKNKTVLDWSTLEEAVAERRRLKRTTDASVIALDRAVHRYKPNAHIAQLDERVIAIGSASHIELLYLHQSPGTSLVDAKLESGKAYVYPAAGGRTQYKVAESARGHFMNRWLPFNASDRQTRSRFQSWLFAWGCGGMYHEGVGPMLAECGIAELAFGPRDLLAKMPAASVSDEWRTLAVRLLEAIDALVGTFPDVRALCAEVNVFTKNSTSDYMHIGDTTLRSPYTAMVRLRRPYAESAGRFVPVPDLCIYVLAQPEHMWFAPQAMYGLALHPAGGYASIDWATGGMARPQRVLTGRLSDVLSVAREYCADSVFIPAA